jgi:hypothetical protein
MNDKIKKYYNKYVFDKTKCSDEKCQKENLPYLTEDDKVINTDKFSERANFFIKNGGYTKDPKGSKAWVDFWNEEHRRIREGYWCGQVRISGDYYFHLNYYRMIIADSKYGEIEAFPKFWSMQFWLSHLFEYCEINKKNFFLIKLRGCGLSELMASKTVRNVLLPDIKGNQKQGKSILLTAADSKYLGGADGLFTKTTRAITWLNQNTDEGIYQPFGHTMKNDEMHWVAGYRHKSSNEPIKTGGEVKATIITKPDDVRGGRYNIIALEESGSNPKLDKMIGIAESNTRRGTIKTGVIFGWGTSNEDSRGIETFKKVLTNPLVYDAIAFDNVWRSVENGKEYIEQIPRNPFKYLIDDDNNVTKGVGYFIPTYDIKCLDEFGNPDREKAYDEIIAERNKKIIGVGDDDSSVLAYIADHPIYMEEALIVSKGKRFSSNELSRQIVNIETKVIEPKLYRGDFEFITNAKKDIIGVQFIPYNKGKVSLLEIPNHATKHGNNYQVFLTNDMPDKLYIAGIDSIDQGTEDSAGVGSSLGCLIKKRFDPNDSLNPFNNTYVGLYNERPKYAKDGWEVVLQMLIFYRAIGLLEYTKIGLKDYIVDTMKLGKYLSYEPKAPGEKITNYKRKQNKKGIRITTDIINFYLGLIEEYIRENNKNILFKQLLEQLSMYTFEDKTKYDLIAAMGMCEILSSEFKEILPTTEVKEVREAMKWYTTSSGKRIFGIPPKKDIFGNVNNYRTPKVINVRTGEQIDTHIDIEMNRINRDI